MRVAYLSMVGGLLWMASLTSQAGILRCGNELVQEGEPVAVVTSRCGKPMLVEDVTARQESSQGELTEIKVGERWTMNMGKGEFMQILTIKDGVVTHIENGPRG